MIAAMKTEAMLILHDIRSAENVGAIFRTADAAGVSRIILSGYTALPVDAFGRKNKKIAKTALGAEETVSWEHALDVSKAITALKRKDFTIAALEQDDTAIDYKEVKLAGPWALLLGNEVEGVSKALLKKADVIVEIPMKGKKESLNVSVATGIALFRMLGI